LSLGLSVSHRLRDLEEVPVDIAVVVAYGVIIPRALLEVMPMLNVHFSLLPRWRGAAPVQRAILAGDERSGVTIISLEETLDTGPIHLERSVEVGDKTADALMNELSVLGAQALVEVLATPQLLTTSTPQVGEATYAEKIDKESLHLLPSMSSELLRRTVRLGGAFFFVDGKRIGTVSTFATPSEAEPGVLAFKNGEVVLGTREGTVALDQIRPEGSKTMTARDWWLGRRSDDVVLRWE
jgi:methionyl-tRNA formyltransferase